MSNNKKEKPEIKKFSLLSPVSSQYMLLRRLKIFHHKVSDREGNELSFSIGSTYVPKKFFKKKPKDIIMYFRYTDLKLHHYCRECDQYQDLLFPLKEIAFEQGEFMFECPSGHLFTYDIPTGIFRKNPSKNSLEPSHLPNKRIPLKDKKIIRTFINKCVKFDLKKKRIPYMLKILSKEFPDAQGNLERVLTMLLDLSSSFLTVNEHYILLNLFRKWNITYTLTDHDSSSKFSFVDDFLKRILKIGKTGKAYPIRSSSHLNKELKLYRKVFFLFTHKISPLNLSLLQFTTLSISKRLGTLLSNMRLATFFSRIGFEEYDNWRLLRDHFKIIKKYVSPFSFLKELAKDPWRHSLTRTQFETVIPLLLGAIKEKNNRMRAIKFIKKTFKKFDLSCVHRFVPSPQDSIEKRLQRTISLKIGTLLDYTLQKRIFPRIFSIILNLTAFFFIWSCFFLGALYGTTILLDTNVSELFEYYLDIELVLLLASFSLSIISFGILKILKNLYVLNKGKK